MPHDSLAERVRRGVGGAGAADEEGKHGGKGDDTGADQRAPAEGATNARFAASMITAWVLADARPATWRAAAGDCCAAARTGGDEQWLAVCQARGRENEAEYLLLYGHSSACAVKQRNPRSIKPSQVSSTSCSRSCGGLSAPVRSIRNASKRPCRHPCAGRSPRGATRTTGAATFPNGALAACMITYAQLHGAITLELLGHVPPPLADYGALFDLGR